MARNGINFNVNVKSSGREALKDTVELFKSLGKEAVKGVNDASKSMTKLQTQEKRVTTSLKRRDNYIARYGKSARKHTSLFNEREQYENQYKDSKNYLSFVEDKGPGSDYAKALGFNYKKTVKPFAEDYLNSISNFNRNAKSFYIPPSAVNNYESLISALDVVNKRLDETRKNIDELENNSTGAINAVRAKEEESKNKVALEIQKYASAHSKNVSVEDVKEYFNQNSDVGFGDNIFGYFKSLGLRPREDIRNKFKIYAAKYLKLENDKEYLEDSTSLPKAKKELNDYLELLGLINSMLTAVETKWDKIAGITKTQNAMNKAELNVRKTDTRLEDNAEKVQMNLQNVKDSNYEYEDQLNNLDNLTEDLEPKLKNLEGITATVVSGVSKLHPYIAATSQVLKIIFKYYVNRLNEVKKKINQISDAIKKNLYKSLYSVFHVLRYMILRMAFRALIKDFTAFFNKYIQYSEEFAEKFNKMYNLMMKLQASVVGMVAPVIKALEPIITSLGNALVRLLNILNMFNAVFVNNQNTWSKAKDLALDYRDALDEAGSSASKQLAAFDTINKLGNSTGSSSSLLDSLDPNDIWEEAQPEQWILDLKEAFDTGWESNDLSDLGTLLADNFNKMIDKGLEAFDKDNISEKLNSKISAFRSGLTSFLNGITLENEDGKSGSSKLGELAADIVNTVISAIVTAFEAEKNGSTWYGSLGTAIADFIAGAIDTINFKNIGNAASSIVNAISRFWNSFYSKLNERDANGVSFATKLGQGLAEAFNTGIESWDAGQSAEAMSGKLSAELDAAIAFLKSANVFKAGVKSGAKLGKVFDEVGIKVIEALGLGILDAAKYLGGYVLGAIGQCFYDIAGSIIPQSKDIEGGSETVALAIGEVLGNQMSLQFTNPFSKAIGDSLLNGCNSYIESEGFTSLKDDFYIIGDETSTELTNGMNTESKVSEELLGVENAAENRREELKNKSNSIGLEIASAYTAAIDDAEKGIVASTSSAWSDDLAVIGSFQEPMKAKSKENGEYVLDCLNEGLSNSKKKTSLLDAMASIGNAISDTFTSLLQINSTSKLFENYGGYIIEGLNNGLRDTSVDTSFTSSLLDINDVSTNTSEELLTTWQTFAEGLNNVFEGISDAFRVQMETMIVMLNTTMSVVQDGLNQMVSAINEIISDYNQAARETGGNRISYVGYARLNSIQIPKLAQGAVIPPNSEFLAVLGDQKQGTNIEAPLDTIVQAFNKALSNGNYNSQKELHIELNKRELAKTIIELSALENRRIGTRLVTD